MNPLVFIGLPEVEKEQVHSDLLKRYKEYNFSLLFNACCETLKINLRTAKGVLIDNKVIHSHDPSMVEARHLFYFLVKRNKLIRSHACLFLGQNHSSTTHAIKAWQDRMDCNDKYHNITSSAEAKYFRSIKKKGYE